MAIVGAGPAGLAAAIAARQVGVAAVVLDDNEQPGGQIYRQPPRGFSIDPATGIRDDQARGRRLLDDAARAGVSVRNGVAVWNAKPGALYCCQGDEAWTLQYETLILATGAYERPLPFPGWTLPGVFTSGGVQSLLKAQRIVAGKRVLLAGTGPLNLVVANQLADAGAQVLAVLELARPSVFDLLPMLAGRWELLAQGIGYVGRLAGRRIPIMRGWTIIEARGKEEVQSAVIAQVDDEWRPIPGSERVLEVDTVCLGFGLLPSTELSQLIGSEHRYAPELGGWIPVCDEYCETSMPGVFVAGDGAGIAGSLVALEEGRVAGLRAAMRLGRIDPKEFSAQAARSLARLRRLGRSRAVLDRISRPRPGLFERITPETVICRCEEVTASEVRKEIEDGATSLVELKARLRVGMGLCQGRICSSTLIELLAQGTGQRPEDVRPFSQRPPVKPIPVSALLALEEACHD
ncbi:MAG: FAD/NAD(P)-binding oxidoreductase [Betaproteobacteria bacterium]|nr:MAG: FAD/NAD(P)-binding oxidoreductase [Betaproteobacteria bacterium]